MLRTVAKPYRWRRGAVKQATAKSLSLSPLLQIIPSQNGIFTLPFLCITEGEEIGSIRASKKQLFGTAQIENAGIAAQSYETTLAVSFSSKTVEFGASSTAESFQIIE